MKYFRQLQEELKPQGTVKVHWDELDMNNIGHDAASRIPEDDGPHTYGIGNATNFVTTVDPSSVVNQQNSDGNREFDMEVAPKKSGKPFKTLRGGKIKLHPEDLTGAVADVAIGEEFVNEAQNKSEYDYEGEMAMIQLRSIMRNAQMLHDELKPETNLPEWVQSKITLAEDYIETAYNYMCSEMNEEVEQIDEISQKTKDSYMAKRGSQLSGMMYAPSPKNYNLLSGKKQANAVKGIKRALNKEEVEHLDELSDALKNRYIKKARKSLVTSLSKKDTTTSDKEFQKGAKRLSNIVRTRASMMREKIEHGMSLLKSVAAHKKAYEYYPKADKSGLPKASIQQYVGEGSAQGAITRRIGDKKESEVQGPRDSAGHLLPHNISFDDYLKKSKEHFDGRRQKWTHHLPNSAPENQHKAYKAYSEKARAEGKAKKEAERAAERKAIEDRKEARRQKKLKATQG